jgi:hypothetical protein
MALGFKTKITKAHVSNSIIAEMMPRAKWDPKAKAGWQKCAAEMGAKYLTKFGVPGGYGPEIGLLICTAKIGKDYLALMRRVDELIALQNKAAAQPAKAPEKEKGAA